MHSLKRLSHFRLNDSTAVFAPFHDSEISPTIPISTTRSPGWDMSLHQQWDSLRVIIKGPGADIADVGSILVEGEVETDEYDTVLVCLTASKSTNIRVAILFQSQELTDSGCVSGLGRRMEITIPFSGSSFDAVRIDFRLLGSSEEEIGLKWLGLVDRSLERKPPKRRGAGGPIWEGLIDLPNVWPDQESLQRGLLFDSEALADIRRKMNSDSWIGLFGVLQAKASAHLQEDPERWIGEYISTNDTRYVREHQVTTHVVFNEALVIGFVGLVTRDLKLARLALRHLMAIVHTSFWCVSDEHRMQGSTWDQRCFMEEMYTTTVSLLTDWYDWALTPRARSLIARSIWDKGLAVIERDMMKWEYVHHINQGPWFCRARILGGLILESSWPRVGNYVDRAVEEMREGLNDYILEDGGIDEGMHYFFATLEAVLPAFFAYSKARNISVYSILPTKLHRSVNFVRCLSSCRPGSFLLDGDNFSPVTVCDSLSILAAIFPEQDYLSIVQPSLDKTDSARFDGHYMGTGVYACIFGPEKVTPPASIVPEFMQLPYSGHLTSLRKLPNHSSVRFHLSGSKANASHAHFDKGSIILEVDSAPILIDRGALLYSHANYELLKKSSMHNVITPIDDSGRSADQASPTVGVIPEGVGDAKSLSASVDLTNVWRNQMNRCVRRIASPSPQEFIVIDQCHFQNESRVAFHLHSYHCFENHGDFVQLVVGKIKLSISAKWMEDCIIDTDSLDYARQKVYHLKLISKKGIIHNLETQLLISVN